MDRAGILTKVKIKMDEVTPPGVDLPFDDFIGPILDECAKEVAEVAPLHLLTPVSLVGSSTTRSVVTNVATIGLSVPHPYKVGNTVTISGFTTDATYNGDFVLTAITASSISYALTHANEAPTADTDGIITYKTMIANDKAYIPKPTDYLRLYELKFPLWTRTVRETTKPDSYEGRMQDNDYLKSGIGRPSVIITTTQPAGGSVGEYLVCGKVAVLAVPLALIVEIPKPETLPDQLIDSLSWLAAAKVLLISGYGDKAQGLMQNYGLSLTSLAQA